MTKLQSSVVGKPSTGAHRPAAPPPMSELEKRMVEGLQNLELRRRISQNLTMRCDVAGFQNLKIVTDLILSRM